MNNTIPVTEHTFDFVVVGGGLAGLCAAIAAARQGARTAILQDRPMFGGNSSSEIRVGPLSAAHFNPWARETGILEELLLTERSRNHDDIYDGMANSHYDLVLHEAAKREPNLAVFLNTSVRGVETEALPDGRRRIVSVAASQLASEKELRVRGQQFADCTGDATVGALAGADFRWGREARSEHGEPMAPVTADNQTMGSTLTMRARNIGRPVPYSPPEWAMLYRTPEELGLARLPNRFNRVDYGGYWWIEVGTPFDQISDNQAIKDELLRHVLGVWNYVKNYSADREIAANYALEWIGMVPGKRESRRLLGDVILTEHDCRCDRQWPDRVAYAGWFIDVHTMGGILNKKEPGEPSNVDENYRVWTREPPFSLPLRALYSRNVANLWMAGRNISVTHVALGATRVMMTHALQGQAVGTAAAHALRHDILPRQAADPAGPHIGRIQQQLLRDDVNVLDLPNADPADLARTAKATADSHAPLDLAPLNGAFLPLSKPHAVIFPVTSETLDALSLYCRNETDASATLQLELQPCERIWDILPTPPVARWSMEIPARFCGWVTGHPRARLTPGRPVRLCLGAAPGVSCGFSSRRPTGVGVQYLHTCHGGCDAGHEHIDTLQPHETDIPAYTLWSHLRRLQPLALQLEPAQFPYAPESVNNGLAWPLAMPNLWVSDPRRMLPQSLTLTLARPERVNTVLVSFDTYLWAPYHDMGAFWRAHTCVRDWRLHALVDGQWRVVFEETGNFLRRRTASFATVTATALKLEILATNHSDLPQAAASEESARVYELRAYCTGGVTAPA
jgi:hypothetical protein